MARWFAGVVVYCEVQHFEVSRQVGGLYCCCAGGGGGL